MSSEIESWRAILETYLGRGNPGCPATVDRAEVVAHASLSALSHHWPSRISAGIRDLLDRTSIVREREQSRWMTQRRIAIAKLARYFNAPEAPDLNPGR